MAAISRGIRTLFTTPGDIIYRWGGFRAPLSVRSSVLIEKTLTCLFLLRLLLLLLLREPVRAPRQKPLNLIFIPTLIVVHDLFSPIFGREREKKRRIIVYKWFLLFCDVEREMRFSCLSLCTRLMS